MPQRNIGMNARADVLELEDFLPYRLSVLSNRISRAIAARYEGFGIGMTEWRVLAVLGRHPALAAAEVSERTAMDKVAVSRAVTALLHKGLVKRALAKDDRRRSVLALTAKGVRMHAQVVPLALGLEAELLEGLTVNQRAALAKILAALDTAVERATGD